MISRRSWDSVGSRIQWIALAQAHHAQASAAPADRQGISVQNFAKISRGLSASREPNEFGGPGADKPGPKVFRMLAAAARSSPPA
jgi:hypothetical protein